MGAVLTEREHGSQVAATAADCLMLMIAHCCSYLLQC